MSCVQQGKDTEGEHAKRGKSEHRRGEVSVGFARSRRWGDLM